jgi:hypothetical protein
MCDKKGCIENKKKITSERFVKDKNLLSKVRPGFYLSDP